MKRYIVRPRGIEERRGGTFSLLSSVSGGLPTDRKALRQEMLSSLAKDPVLSDLGRWTKERRERGDLSVLLRPERPSAAGTVVVSMKEDVAESLARELPDVELVEDTPIGLLHAVSEGKPATTINRNDCWHLNYWSDVAGTNLAACTGRGVRVAVLDSGIVPHVDLGNRVISRHEAINATVEPRTPHGDDDNHGTSVASLIAGASVGVAPDAQIVDIQVWHGRTTLKGDLIAALQWCFTDEKADVDIVNLSLGEYRYDPLFDVEIRALLGAGVLPVGAIGNRGVGGTCSPANQRGVLSVGAVDREGRVTPYSGWQQFTVQPETWSVPALVAPGHEVWCAVKEGGFRERSGTSFAAAVTTGVAARMLEAVGPQRADILSNMLQRRCEPLPGFDNRTQGAGCLR